MPDDYFSSSFYHEAVEQASKEFKRLRITLAFIEERKHHTPKPWREIMVGYKNLDKAFAIWNRLHEKRRFSIGLLDALEVSLETLQKTIALDKIEWEKEVERNPSVTTYQYRAMPTIYPVVKLPEGLSCDEAIELVRKGAVERKCKCVCESSVALYLFDAEGKVGKYPYEPRFDVGTDHVSIKG